MAETKVNPTNQLDLDNPTGAYIELTQSVTIGKNLLAQSLTDKGVQTSSSETLIQMADKVEGLNIDSSIENITGRYYNRDGSGTALSSMNAHNRFFKHPTNGSIIILYGPKIYYIPDGEYYTWDEFLAGATHVYDVTTENANYTFNIANECFATNRDCTYLLASLGNNIHNIYSIDPTNGITLVKTFTYNLISHNTNNVGVGLSDNGRYIFYRSAASTMSIYDVETETKTDCSISLASAGNSKLYTTFMTPTHIYCLICSTGESYKTTRSFRFDWSATDADGVNVESD